MQGATPGGAWCDREPLPPPGGAQQQWLLLTRGRSRAHNTLVPCDAQVTVSCRIVGCGALGSVSGLHHLCQQSHASNCNFYSWQLNFTLRTNEFGSLPLQNAQTTRP